MTPERLREIATIIYAAMLDNPADGTFKERGDFRAARSLEAARAIAPLIEAARAEGQKDMQERCRQAIYDNQETIREASNGSERYVSPRKRGNLAGLAFADAIAALPIDGANQIQSPPAPDREAVARLIANRMREFLTPAGSTAYIMRKMDESARDLADAILSLLGGTR